MRLYTDESFLNTIISAVNEKKLILFIGAGFSKLCGLPLWNTLADSLINACVEEDDINFSYADRNMISKNKDSKTLITIAYYLFEESGKLDTFNSLMYKFLSNLDDSPETTKTRNKLMELVSFSGATVLTTNSDSILHNCFGHDDFIYYRLEDIYKFEINNHRQLLHLHGYKGDMKTMVYTARQYLERYADKKFKRKIRDIFNSDYTILFIGYGLNEMQLLDFLIDESDVTKNRFVLDGFFGYEEADFLAKQHYYKAFDIQLIGYHRDDNDYLELVQALNYLIEESMKKSSHKPETYLQAISLLEKKPSKKMIHKLNNTLQGLTSSKIRNVMFEIVKSSYRNEWIKYIYRNDYFGFFDLKPLKDYEASDIGFDIPILYVLQDIYLKDKSEEIYPIIRDFLISLVSYSKLIIIFEQDSHLSRVISRIIFSDYRFVNNKSIYDFVVKQIEDSKNTKDWITWITYETTELTKTYKNRRLGINKIILKRFSEDKYNSYEFENYLDVFGFELSKDFPNESFKQLNSKFNQLYSEGYWLFSDAGSLIYYSESGLKNRESYDSTLLRWYIYSSNLINPKKIISLFRKCISKDSELAIKFSLVLLYNNFDLLKSELFALSDNPFNDWIKYSDLYCILSRKWVDMTRSDKRHIMDLIDTMKIDGISDFYSFVCQYDLYELIGRMKDEKESRQRAIAMKSQLIEEENNKYLQFQEPILRNRRSWSSTSTITGDDEYKSKLSKMTIVDFFDSVSSDLNDNQRHTVNSIYTDYFERVDLLQWIVKDEYRNLNLIIDKSNRIIFEYLLRSSEVIPFSNISGIFNEIENLTSNPDEFRKDVTTFISDLHFKYIKKVEDIADYKEVYDFCMQLYQTYTFNWDVKPNNKSKITIISFLVLEAYQVFALLSICAYKTNNKDFIEELDKLLKEDSEVALAKAFIIANVDSIWFLDNSWVESNIFELFQNTINNQNISNIAFQLSLFYKSDFIDKLLESNIFGCILNDEDFNEHKWAFIHNILTQIDKYKDSKKILVKIATTKNNFGGVNSYFSAVAKLTDLSHIERSISIICDVFSDEFRSSEKISSMLIVNLLKIYPKLVDKTSLWKFILSIISNHGTYYTREITSSMKKSGMENERKVLFIEKYVYSLSDHFYRIDEVYELICLVDWSEKGAKRQELITKLGDINPEIWKIEKQKRVS